MDQSEFDIDMENNYNTIADSINGDKHQETKRAKVKFKEPKGGKVLPSESKTGKGAVKKVSKDRDEMFAVDQTLAGTFSDVSEVFGKKLCYPITCLMKVFYKS